MMKTDLNLKVTRLKRGSGVGQTELIRVATQGWRANRSLFVGCGGSGQRVGVHLKALDELHGGALRHLCLDSDRGDHYETTLPGGRVVRYGDDELCNFGVEDARTRLLDDTALAARFRPLLRGNPVAETYGRGAGQCRAMGMLDYELDIETIHHRMVEAIRPFMPITAGKQMTMQEIVASRDAQAEQEKPMNVWCVGSGCGGLNSSIFIHNAYYLQHVLEQHGINNFVLLGVLLGPKAYQKRGPNIGFNYAALLRELEQVNREGFAHTFANGEAVRFARPPFKLLFQLDLVDWPADENLAERLSDHAMDAWLRHVALGIHLLDSAPMQDRLQTLIRNPTEQSLALSSSGAGLMATFGAALVSVNFQALAEVVALERAIQTMDNLIEQCGE
jgi:hypothetical protein